MTLFNTEWKELSQYIFLIISERKWRNGYLIRLTEEAQKGILDLNYVSESYIAEKGKGHYLTKIDRPWIKKVTEKVWF